ncbi:hypothetical protein ACFYN3_25030 [Streptomyces lavendulae]|uniref:hypothetical protein n=1 Tax=Streptomyces lavendulae TaxID=1914 RepID=UPI0036B5CEC1
MIDTPERLEQGSMLAAFSIGSGRARVIVPREYTHLRVRPGRGGRFPRWKFGFRGSGSLAELGNAAEGKGEDVLRYTGGRTTVRLELKEAGRVTLRLRSFSGGYGAELITCDGPFRGTVDLPGPGLIEVDSRVPWTITV